MRRSHGKVFTPREDENNAVRVSFQSGNLSVLTYEFLKNQRCFPEGT